MSPKNNTTNTGIIDKFKQSEQLISMIMGILLVLLIGGFAYRYFQSQVKTPPTPETSSSETSQEKTESKKTETTLPQKHQVARGENLWQIAERYYQSGYNWVDIARENKLTNPNLLLVGQELVIPNVPSRKLTVANKSQPTTSGVTIKKGGEYTIKKGDSLSKIAGAVYGDIFLWPKIWAANRDQIHNPNLIFPGQKIKIPN